MNKALWMAFLLKSLLAFKASKIAKNCCFVFSMPERFDD